MTILKQATWLPLFIGYYESPFDPSDSFIEMETDLSDDEIKKYYGDDIDPKWFRENAWDYVKIDWDGLGEAITYAILDVDNTGIIKDVEYEKTCSPKYYNFSTDSINCMIEYDSDKMMSYLNNNIEAFKDYLIEKYTRRDGFIPSYSNELVYWMNTENHSDHELGSILQFILVNEGKDWTDLLCSISDHYNYVSIDLTTKEI